MFSIGQRFQGLGSCSPRLTFYFGFQSHRSRFSIIEQAGHMLQIISISIFDNKTNSKQSHEKANACLASFHWLFCLANVFVVGLTAALCHHSCPRNKLICPFKFLVLEYRPKIGQIKKPLWSFSFSRF